MLPALSGWDTRKNQNHKKKTKIEETEEKRHLKGQSTQTSKRNDYSLTKGSHF